MAGRAHSIGAERRQAVIWRERLRLARVGQPAGTALAGHFLETVIPGRWPPAGPDSRQASGVGRQPRAVLSPGNYRRFFIVDPREQQLSAQPCQA